MKRSFKKILSVVLGLALVCTGMIVPATAETESDTIKILAIGNSYSNNSTQYISSIAESMGLDITAASLYYPGCELKRHVAHYEAYETLGRDGYYADSNTDKYEYFIVDGGETDMSILSIQEAIAYTDWDYITLQQMPNGCDDIDTYWTEDAPYLTKLYGYVSAELAKNNNTECEILLNQGWSFSHAMSVDNAYVYYPVDYENTKDFFDKIEETVNEAAGILMTECGLDTAPSVVPSGKAVQLAKDEFGFADSYGEDDSLYADYISHLSPIGRYLVGCVWVETFAAKAGLTADTRTATYIPENVGMTADMAAALRSCAHEAVTGESGSITGDWRAVPYGDGLKITHYEGTVSETGTVTVPAVLGEKTVLCIDDTVFKYVDGVKAVILESNSVVVEDGALNGIVSVKSFWDGTSVQPSGSGTETAPYIITNAAELHWAVTQENTDKYFELANDIYINDISVDTATGTVKGDTSKEWFTSSDTKKTFKGHIDGKGHTVSGMYIDEACEVTTSAWNIGMGLIPNGAGTVKNLGVVNSYVKAEGYAAAGLIGSTTNSTRPFSIENCFVGQDVYINGTVAAGLLGGGDGQYITKIENCYSLATLVATGHDSGTFYGGLTGQVWSCQNVPAVNCYTSSRIYGQHYMKYTNCFAVETKASQNGLTVITADRMKGGAAANAMTLGSAYYATDSYPTLKIFVSGFDTAVWGGLFDKELDTDSDGNYLVTSAEELAYIAFGNAAKGSSYKLTTDICLNDTDRVDWTTGTPEDGYTPFEWADNVTFSGNFDGDGHVVRGIWYPSGNNSDIASFAPVGLFARLGADVTVKNVGVESSYLESVGHVGAVAGYANGSNILIDSCYSDNSVTVNSKVSDKVPYDVSSSGILGGIVGYDNITVSNCYSFANLTGDNHKYKIIASNWQDPASDSDNIRIENCFADGSLCIGASEKTRLNGIVNSYSTAAPTNTTYQTWTQLSESEMKGAKALWRMSGLGDKFIAVAKDYPVLKIFNPDLTEPDTSYWDGAAVAPANGTGSETDPYLISTAEEFAYMVYTGGEGKYYKLTADICFNKLDAVNWTNGEIITDGYAANEWYTSDTTGGNTYNGSAAGMTFSGTVDGDGHTVYGLYYTPGHPGTVAGLFPAVTNATIKNLAVETSFVAGGRWTGVLVGAINTEGNTLTVDSVVIGDSVTVLAYNSGNYYYDGRKKSDGAYASSPFSGAVSGTVRFESVAAGGIVGYVATKSTANITNTAVYAVFNGDACTTEYSNPYANGGEPYVVGSTTTLYGLMGTCWNPAALNFSNCITTTNPVNNSNAPLGTPNFTMSNIYNTGDASTRDGVVNVTAADITGASALAETALSGDVWYAVKADGAYPSLRTVGTERGDVDENGEFTLAADAAALRGVIIKGIAPSNGDANKDGSVNVCDLVSLHIK